MQVPTVDPPTEIALSALKVVVGALPMRTLTLLLGGDPSAWSASVMAMVEAVGLDARCGLLPGTASAWLVRQRAQRLREVRRWALERDA